MCLTISEPGIVFQQSLFKGFSACLNAIAYCMRSTRVLKEANGSFAEPTMCFVGLLTTARMSSSSIVTNNEFPVCGFWENGFTFTRKPNHLRLGWLFKLRANATLLPCRWSNAKTGSKQTNWGHRMKHVWFNSHAFDLHNETAAWQKLTACHTYNRWTAC